MTVLMVPPSLLSREKTSGVGSGNEVLSGLNRVALLSDACSSVGAVEASGAVGDDGVGEASASKAVKEDDSEAVGDDGAGEGSEAVGDDGVGSGEVKDEEILDRGDKVVGINGTSPALNDSALYMF